MTTDEDMRLIHGGGNVLRDFGDPNPNLEQARAMLAAKIIAILDERELTVPAAQAATGVAAAEFSRIRNVRQARFTLDRMIEILGKLDEEVEATVAFDPRGAAEGVRKRPRMF